MDNKSEIEDLKTFLITKLGYLKFTDGITMNRDRLLYDAKVKALELSKNYKFEVSRIDSLLQLIKFPVRHFINFLSKIRHLWY